MLVGVRVRQALGTPSSCIKTNEVENTIEINMPPKEGKEAGSQSFAFDVVLGAQTHQEDVWGQLRIGELVDKVCDGYNGTVFAYGQTGAGKTHTMSGIDPAHENHCKVAP